MKFFSIALLFIFHAVRAHSADISAIEDPSSNVLMVLINGEIVEGDAAKFTSTIGSSDRVIVALQSPGGLVNEAIQIGANIRQRGFSTTALADTECMSACALIWVAGARRYMDENSTIGVHAAYRIDGDSYQESGMANAEIGSYLTHLGLRIEAIRFFTAAPPDQISVLTPLAAMQLGIEVYLSANGQRYTPSDLPTMDTLAELKSALLFAGGGCHKLFGFDDPQFKREFHDIEETAEVFDYEDWTELSLMTLEQYSKAPVFPIACLRAEKAARQGGYVLFSTPSFDCGKAGTIVEFSICENADLIAADRVMSSLYFAIKSADLTKEQSEGFRTFQRGWLADRDSCGHDINCLIGTYEDLISFYDTFGVTPL